MKLFHFATSTYARKVRKCLELKGLAFELVEVPYLDRRELVALTGGYMQVPVLEDDGRVIVESAAITAYLDERYAPSLRPAPLAGAAMVFEQWADTVLEDTAFRIESPLALDVLVGLNGGRVDVGAMYRFTKERKFGAGCIEAWRDGEGKLTAQLAAIVAPLGVALAEHAFLLASTPTLADAAVWGPLSAIELVKPGWVRANLPALGDWYDRMLTARA